MQAIARANRVFPGKENGTIVDFLGVFRYLRRALADYASDDSGDMPVKEIEKLLTLLNEAIEMTLEFCKRQGADLTVVASEGDVFGKLPLFRDYANIIVGNDEVRNEFNVLANTVGNLYESLRPDIFKMEFDPTYKEAILYLQGVIDGAIRPEKLESAKARIDKLLDQSVMVAEDAVKYTIMETGKEIDISKMDLDELRDKFKRTKTKNLEIASLRGLIEKKLAQMLKRNITRSNFAERFMGIIDAYNTGGSQNDDFYEKILKIMEELKEEEERHIREKLTEEELAIFDLLRKDPLTKNEEQRVKLAAKSLYKTLCDRKSELFIVGWQDDPQPLEKVRAAIQDSLDNHLPECYDSDLFKAKRDVICNFLIDQARAGHGWVA
jgi:type I restriction enzyme R subunit